MSERGTRGRETAETEVPAKGRLVWNAAFCRTCRVCEQACSISHEGVARPAVARINVFFDEFATQDEMIRAVYCLQCDDAPCMAACPNDAMRRDSSTGAVIVMEENCTGCMRCRKACEWKVPKLHPERKVSLKCDLCLGRAEGPACVQFCPVVGKALLYSEHYYVRETADAAV